MTGCINYHRMSPRTHTAAGERGSRLWDVRPNLRASCKAYCCYTSVQRSTTTTTFCPDVNFTRELHVSAMLSQAGRHALRRVNNRCSQCRYVKGPCTARTHARHALDGDFAAATFFFLVWYRKARHYHWTMGELISTGTRWPWLGR